jgi:transposase
MSVMIGIDPHKASHTAVAIDGDEDQLSSVKVRATRRRVDQLMNWAEPFEKRTWAIESAGGLGYLLAQQLVARGEEVLDVPATLASRVRTLATNRSNKNDPNDAYSIAIAALQAPKLRGVVRADHGEVLRLLAKRNTDIGNHRTRVVCRLHALLAKLAPGGITKEMYVSEAGVFMAELCPETPAQQMRFDLALEILDDVRRLDAQLKESHRRIRVAIKASGASLTETYGVGRLSPPRSSATRATSLVLPTATPTLLTTARHPLSSPRRDGSCIGFSLGAAASSTMPFTWPPSPSSVIPELQAGSTSSARSSRARPRKKQSAPSSATSAMPFTVSSSSTPNRGSGRTIGNDS